MTTEPSLVVVRCISPLLLRFRHHILVTTCPIPQRISRTATTLLLLVWIFWKSRIDFIKVCFFNYYYSLYTWLFRFVTCIQQNIFVWASMGPISTHTVIPAFTQNNMVLGDIYDENIRLVAQMGGPKTQGILKCRGLKSQGPLYCTMAPMVKHSGDIFQAYNNVSNTVTIHCLC